MPRDRPTLITESRAAAINEISIECGILDISVCSQ